jgi:hypothetical protein
MKVVIIGNSSNILQSKNGNLIDSFDKIIRLGQFVISGYEEHVGTRTDVCITRWGKYTKITPTERQHIGDIWFPHPVPPNKYSDRYYSGAEHACNLAEYNITNERYIDIEDMCAELKSPDLTLGTASILMAQKYLSEYDMYITGYCLDMTDDRLKGKYWDTQITQWNDNHNLLTETMYIRRLINNNDVYQLD